MPTPPEEQWQADGLPGPGAPGGANGRAPAGGPRPTGRTAPDSGGAWTTPQASPDTWVPEAPARPGPRRRWHMIAPLLAAVPFFAAALGLFWLAHSSHSARQWDPAMQDSDIVETEALPWALEGEVAPVEQTPAPSDSWFKGAREAWKIDAPALSRGGFEQTTSYAANGSTLITLQGANAWQSTIKGWDIGGAQPRQLWAHTVQITDSPTIGAEEAGVWVGSTLFADGYAINGRTGQIVSLTWMRSQGSGRRVNDLAVTADGLLVACDPSPGQCSARKSDGSVVWASSTGLKGHTMRGTALGGGDEWIWLDGGAGAVSFVNTRTGQVNEERYGSTGPCWRAGARDGWLIACHGDTRITAFQADGTPAGVFDAAHWPVPASPEGECSNADTPVWAGTPTLDEAIAYYRDSDASSTLGTLTPADCEHIEYTSPTGASTTIDLSDDPERRAFTLGDFGQQLQKQLAISADGRILAIGNSMLVDLTSGRRMDMASVGSPDMPLLATPGLMLAADRPGVRAIAPRE